MSDEINQSSDEAEEVVEPTAENVVFSDADAEALSEGNEVEALRAETAELKDRILRSQAELENFRRRSQKESLEAMKYSSMPVIRDLLPGIDNLQRALGAAEQSGDTQNLVEGIKMVVTQFVEALKSHSAIPIEPEGQPFDPNLHEALTQVPSADHEPMTVLQVIESGYKIHDRVIRPAKVMVSCAPPEPAAEDATDA